MSQTTLTNSPYHNSSLFSGYYLDERIDDLEGWDCDPNAQDAFEKLQHLWELEGELLPGYKEDELLDSWIDEVLDILGFGTQSETTVPGGGGYNDRLLFDSEETRREAAKRALDGDNDAMYGKASAVLEAKQWNADFNSKLDEQRSYRDASHQIKYYLERTPERLQWGILTDGKKWRLYGTKDYATEIYYEVDLPELLESGDLRDFKYFYAFFRPEAFHETAGTTFLDTVWNESETAAQELGEDLQDNVFTALRVLGEGFIHTNDLDIDPDDEDARQELKEQSLVLLYRLMFVLYAESRGLINPDDPRAQAEFDENFSLDQVRLDIHERVTSGDSYDDYSGYATQIWGQLEDLFRLIDEGEDDLGIPPYNGGLFDADDHVFLAENEVADRYIAEVIHRLGTTADEDDNPVLADYADLDTRHLGSIYEGLLEHEFRIAPEQYAAVAENSGQVWKPATEVSVAEAVETVNKGDLYVVNDEGERKATGAYYTPDYVVSYIVEETIDPLLDEIRTELEADGLDPSDQAYFARFYSEVLDLKIVDPAMGSAHFLTSATAYLTEQVMEIVREQEKQGRDEQALRRTIAKECIYGVDINGMAVELGKLSMWLETLAADQPLAFLDHHLKAGNSLIGSDVTKVLSDDTQKEDGQLTLTQVAARARRQTLDHVMDLMGELLDIDNETLADIKSMEQIYDEIRSDALYQRLFEIANVYTAEQFGLDVPRDEDNSGNEDVYRMMAKAIEDSEEWAEIRQQDWFRTAQEMADDEDFFHWELEFPEVFFDEDGEKLAGAGFDAVVGNPPYAPIQRMREEDTSYYNQQYQSASGNYDLYVLFTEKGTDLIEDSGQFGFIIPNKLFQVDYGESLRENLATNNLVSGVVDFGSNQVFAESATTYTTLLFLQGDERETPFEYWKLRDGSDPASISQLQESDQWLKNTFRNDDLSESVWAFQPEEISSIIDQAKDCSITLGQLASGISRGTSSGRDKVFELEVEGETEQDLSCTSKAEDNAFTIESDAVRRPIHSTDFEKHAFLGTEKKRLIWPYDSEYNLLSENEFKSSYPNTWEYLNRHRESLESRADFSKWYGYSAPRNLEVHDSAEILIPLLADGPSFSKYPEPQSDYILMASGGFSISLEEESNYSKDYVLSLINSRLLFLCLQSISNVFRGGYITCTKQYFQQLPIRTIEFETPDAKRTELVENAIEIFSKDGKSESEIRGLVREHLSGEEQYTDVVHDILSYLTGQTSDYRSQRNACNLSLRDHLGTYSDGQTLADVGLAQPPEGSANSILQETTEQKPNLRTGRAEVNRESNTVEIRLTARYKPDDEDAYETDQWGYTETEPLPALRITDLTDAEADLIESFVPMAVDEANGFADFRETATQTNSLVDRLRALTLPAIKDVQQGLESYIEAKERADELEKKIDQTDELIDDIVYELYGLTDEDIEIVEEEVGK
ncbi:type I restriction enzyme family protein [Natrinema mahii]|nr:type I restriction enzyme family protein [Natrinema mahii]